MLLGAVLTSPTVRASVALMAADAWTALRPPTAAAATAAPPTPADELRRLRAECLRLRRLADATPDPRPSVVTTDAITASVLWTTPAGRKSVIAVTDVPKSSDAAIDGGADVGIDADCLVLLGTSIAGRTGQTTRRSACVIPVTSPDFTLGAGLVRDAGGGPVEGPEGVYVGTSTGGSLTMIPAERAVRVGDDVYSLRRSTWSPRRLAIGRVTAATLAPHARHWTISVEPFARPQRHDVVTVLRPHDVGTDR